jgi:hypothetical protein
MTPKRPANSRLKRQLKSMSADELVDLFRDFALDQNDALLGGEQRRVNALFGNCSISKRN